MKKFAVALAVATLASTVAFAEGEGSGGLGSEDVIRLGGGTTVVGRCYDATLIPDGNGSYTVVCSKAEGLPSRIQTAEDARAYWESQVGGQSGN